MLRVDAINDLRRHTAQLDSELRDCVARVIDSGWFILGRELEAFEAEFARYCGTGHCIGVANGTDALELALRACGVGAGGSVLTVANAGAYSTTAIRAAGAEPLFIDIDDESLLIDTAEVRRRLASPRRPSAVILTHLYGRLVPDIEIIAQAAKDAGVPLIEDCAQAHGARRDGKQAGTFGDFGCFSFYVTKNVTTVEGGMIACSHADDAAVLKTLALHGMSADAWDRYRDQGFVHYDVVAPGYKYNLTDLAAAFGIHQLARVESSWLRRDELWSYYERELVDLPLILPPPVPANMRHARHLFTCCVDDARTAVTRDEVLAALHALRIGAGVHYRPVHLHAYYRRAFGHREGDYPTAEWIGERTFSLPLSAGVSDEDAADVVRALRRIFSR